MLSPGAVHARRDEPAEEVSASGAKRDVEDRPEQTEARRATGSTKPQATRQTLTATPRWTGHRPTPTHPPQNRGASSPSATRAGDSCVAGGRRRHNRRLATSAHQRAGGAAPAARATQPGRTMSISPHRAPDTAARARRVQPRKVHATRPRRPSRRKRHDGPTGRRNAGLACARPDAAPHDAGDEGRQPHREGPPRWRAGQAASGRRAAR